MKAKPQVNVTGIRSGGPVSIECTGATLRCTEREAVLLRDALNEMYPKPAPKAGRTTADEVRRLARMLETVATHTSERVRARRLDDMDLRGAMRALKGELMPLLCQIHRFVSVRDMEAYMRERNEQHARELRS